MNNPDAEPLKRQIGSELEAMWEEGIPPYQAMKMNRWGIFYLSTKAGRLLAYILRKESWLSASMWVSNSWRTLSEAVTRRGLGDNCCGALSKTSSTSSMHSNTTWVRDENSCISSVSYLTSGLGQMSRKSGWEVDSLLLFCHEIPCHDIQLACHPLSLTYLAGGWNYMFELMCAVLEDAVQNLAKSKHLPK